MCAMLCGAARVDITPNVGLPLAGYSSGGALASGVRGHLFARALYAEDPSGSSFALVVADLHSGTRYLLERTAERTRSQGIGVERLVVCGTHTHSGPGNLYGNSLYDHFSQRTSGRDGGLSDWMAERIALAVQHAREARRPSRLAFARVPVWGVSRNRSPAAFDANHGADGWHDAGRPGAGWTGSPSDPGGKVDPRMSVITVVDDAHDTIRSVFGFFGCHTTALGMQARYYAPDWAGHACRRARWDLERRGRGTDIVVALGQGAGGDVNALRDHMVPPWTQGPTLAQHVGLRIGRELAAAAAASVPSAREHDIGVLYAEPTTASGAAHPVADARLAEDWMFGVAGVAGAEDGRTGFYHLGLAEEGATGDTPIPHHPKAKAGGMLQDLLKDIFDLDPGAVLPLHAVRIGGHWLVTVPGEPTAFAGADIEEAVADATGGAVTVVGYAGDYMGYFPTAAEYDLQHYEGGSALFGRNSARHVQTRLVELTSAGVTPPLGPRPIDFGASGGATRFRRPESIRPSGIDPNPRIERAGLAVHLRWEMDWDDVLPFADGWSVRIEEEVGPGAWRPVQVEGRDLDDVESFIHIHRDGTFGLGTGATRWHADIRLPGGLAASGRLRVRVRERHPFAGFSIDLPPP